jgi:hypothetical protein
LIAALQRALTVSQDTILMCDILFVVFLGRAQSSCERE